MLGAIVSPKSSNIKSYGTPNGFVKKAIIQKLLNNWCKTMIKSVIILEFKTSIWSFITGKLLKNAFSYNQTVCNISI